VPTKLLHLEAAERFERYVTFAVARPARHAKRCRRRHFNAITMHTKNAAADLATGASGLTSVSGPPCHWSRPIAAERLSRHAGAAQGPGASEAAQSRRLALRST